jgi:hypothetical protein
VSDDKTARIWDAATGKEITVLRGHEGAVQSAAFSPDGARIVTASDDKTARIWDVHFAMMSTNNLVAEACLRRLRGLTTLTRDEMRLAGYTDEVPAIDVCAGNRVNGIRRMRLSAPGRRKFPASFFAVHESVAGQVFGRRQCRASHALMPSASEKCQGTESRWGEAPGGAAVAMGIWGLGRWSGLVIVVIGRCGEGRLRLREWENEGPGTQLRWSEDGGRVSLNASRHCGSTVRDGDERNS